MKFLQLNLKNRSVKILLVAAILVICCAIPFSPILGIVGAAFEGKSGNSSQGKIGVPSSQLETFEVEKMLRGAPALPSSELVGNVNDMLREQTALAQGRADAALNLKRAMKKIATLLSQSDIRTMSIQDEDAAVTYALSGGSPEVLQRLLSQSKRDLQRQSLYSASLEFSNGNLDLASQKLAGVEPWHFQNLLGARAAMLKAQVSKKLPYAQRYSLLSGAANRALGTLIEEAATRRLISLAAAGSENLDFVYWTTRYERRFPKSVYFDEFWSSATGSIFDLENQSRRLSVAQIADILRFLPKSEIWTRLEAFIIKSLEEGRPRLCGIAVAEATKRIVVTERDVARLRLFDAACSVSDNPAAVANAIASVSGEGLNSDDSDLLAAVKQLARGILATNKPWLPSVGIIGPQLPFSGFEMVRKKSASITQQFDVIDKLIKRAAP